MENKIEQGWIEVTPGWDSDLEIIDLGERHFRRKKSIYNRYSRSRW